MKVLIFFTHNNKLTQAECDSLFLNNQDTHIILTNDECQNKMILIRDDINDLNIITKILDIIFNNNGIEEIIYIHHNQPNSDILSGLNDYFTNKKYIYSYYKDMHEPGENLSKYYRPYLKPLKKNIKINQNSFDIRWNDIKKKTT